MATDRISIAEAFVKDLLHRELGPEYAYHNWEHTQKVFEQAQKLGQMAKLGSEDTEILLLAALFHDVGFIYDYDQHEEQSKDIARKFLKENEVSESMIKAICQVIDATKRDVKPATHLQQLLKDADVANLADADYAVWSERLRQELMSIHDDKIKKKGWLKTNIDFFSHHEYYSPEGKKLLGKGKEANLDLLLLKRQEQLLEQAKALRPSSHLSRSLAQNRPAQNQFKTALRNHVNLSSIADNKANHMLSVNALILSISLPFLGSILKSNQQLLIPTLMLIVVCVIAIIFSTLATRPVKMSGITLKEDIDKNKSNLFFFGNFFKMTFDDYVQGIKHIVAEDDRLDQSITRDLFYLGKALGQKYTYLRHCYNFFMYGIVITAFAFMIAFLSGANTL